MYVDCNIGGGIDGTGGAPTAAGGFTVCYRGLVITANDERGYLEALQRVRQQIAVYASTPAYRAVLDLHGWGPAHRTAPAIQNW